MYKPTFHGVALDTPACTECHVMYTVYMYKSVIRTTMQQLAAISKGNSYLRLIFILCFPMFLHGSMYKAAIHTTMQQPFPKEVLICDYYSFYIFQCSSKIISSSLLFHQPHSNYAVHQSRVYAFMDIVCPTPRYAHIQSLFSLGSLGKPRKYHIWQSSALVDEKCGSQVIGDCFRGKENMRLLGKYRLTLCRWPTIANHWTFYLQSSL